MALKFATGKHAIAVCDRCGFKYPYLSLSTEAGTKLRVCSECNDGMWNRVDHPLNKPPKNLVDAVALPNPRPEADETLSDSLIAAESDLIIAENSEILE